LNKEVLVVFGMRFAKSIERETLTKIPTKDMNMNMNMNVSLAPLVSLIAGILILVAPRLLNYIVAIYLIAIGLIGLFGASAFHIK